MDENTVIFFVIAVVAVVITVVSVMQGKKSKNKRSRFLGELAVKLGGNIKSGTLFKQPELHFRHADKPCRLTFYSTGGKHPVYYTRFFMRPGAQLPYETRIYKEGFLQRISKKLGFQDIQVDDATFDDKYMIKGSNEARVKEFLKQPVREAIMQLESIRMNKHIEVATVGKELRIQKLTWLDAPDLLESFIELSCIVAEGYLGGTRLSRLADTQASQETCPVCNDPLKGSSRSCPACGAPHHPECWTLNDGCGRCGHKEA